MPVIYPDRFMISNRQFVEDLRRQVKILRIKIQQLNRCLLKYTNFNNSHTSIEQVLYQSLQFFQK